jgi:hypothetical protein
MAEHRYVRQQSRLDFLCRPKPLEQRRPIRVNERLDRLDPRREPGRGEVFALADEQAQPLALAPRAQPPHQLEPGICG